MVVPSVVRRGAGCVCLFFAAIVILVTALSAIRSNMWWVRVLDFPRVPMIGAIVLITLGCAVTMRAGRWWAVAALAVAGGWQFWRIHDYTPVVPAEMALSGAGTPSADCFKAIGLNVFQHNRDYARTIAMLRREQPDVLLLMETDDRWRAALEPLLAAYPHVRLRPLDNTYGMIFASKLPVQAAHFEQATDANTPTLYARLATRSGQPFAFIGLHPRPPLPGQDTGRRDSNIARAGRHASREAIPSLAMGDFNDVAWSRTTQLFKAAAGYHDPRVGRGPYATFPAQYVLLGWPLDQVFATPAFRAKNVAVLDDVGSDHRPLMATMCLPSGGAERRDPDAEAKRALAKTIKPR